jgi:CRP/FNR family cyclic AMP-dependent transcriptional regulator
MFPAICEEDIAFIAQHGTTKTFGRNSVIVNEGETADFFYLILEGRVRVYVVDDNGREAVLGHLGPHQFFGELAFFTESPRSASVMTIERAKLVVLARGDLEICLRERPSLALAMIPHFIDMIRKLTETVRSLALQDVYGRVVSLLYRISVIEDGKRVLQEVLTHQEIADMVGASREMVSRIMRDLTIGGYLVTDHKRIRIEKDPPARY